MKTRIQLEKKLQKLVMKGTDQFISALSKEDPEKVKGFLKDLSEDDRLSPDVRSIFTRIHIGMLSGKTIEEVVNEPQPNGVSTDEAIKSN
jgi:hypothetical protein